MPNKRNLILNILIFAAFLVVANPSLTRMTIHEWLVLAFAAAIVTHLLFHWRWLVCVTQKLFHKSRLNYVVDILFFIAMTAAMFSGLLISKNIMTTLGIHLEVSRSWKIIHTFASDAALILLGLHFTLHFNWIVSSLKHYLIVPILRVCGRSGAETPVPQTVRIHQDR